jgi:hypothetical protein
MVKKSPLYSGAAGRVEVFESGHHRLVIKGRVGVHFLALF